MAILILAYLASLTTILFRSSAGGETADDETHTHKDPTVSVNNPPSTTKPKPSGGGDVHHHAEPPRISYTHMKPKRKSLNPVLPNSNKCSEFGSRRDYYTNPIILNHPGEGGNPPREFTWSNGRTCDIPCFAGTGFQHSEVTDGHLEMIIGGNAPSARCEYSKRVVISMESDINYPSIAKSQFKGASNKTILATYDLDTDVPTPYFSWDEYDFFSSTEYPKTAKADMAVFISNCGGSNGRLEYLQKMRDAGLTLHSFGGCMKNQNIDHGISKIDVAEKYHFLCAFENSNTKDYVTEKLFQGFVAGTIPVHMGIKNIHDFAPTPNSLISVHDYESPEATVKFMKYLIANSTAYKEYIGWKTNGVSKQFRALVDLSNMHSFCRACIRTGDLHRWQYGWANDVYEDQNPYHEENLLAKKNAVDASNLRRSNNNINSNNNDDMIMIKARERGKFWFKAIFLREKTIKELHEQIRSHYTDYKELYEITNIRKTMFDDKIRYKNDDDVQKLTDGSEIEIIFLYILEGTPPGTPLNPRKPRKPQLTE